MSNFQITANSQPELRNLAGVNHTDPNQSTNRPSQIQVRPINFSPVSQPTQPVRSNSSATSPSPFPGINNKPISKPVNEQSVYPIPNTAKDVTNSCEITSIKPTFTLRWINIINVIDNCVAGKYDNIKVIPNSVNLYNKTIEIVKTGVTHNDPIQKYHMFGGDYRKIATTNCNAVQLTYSNLNNRTGIKCRLCDNNIPSNTYPVGIPVKMIVLPNNKLLFMMVDMCCGFRHAYKHLIRETNKYATHLMSELYDSESLLKILFGLIYPGRILKDAPDPDLLDSNGGSLSQNMYDNGDETYTQLEYTLPYIPNQNIDLRFIGANYMIQE